MANRYGEAALLTARAEAEYLSHPAERWNEVVGRLYPTSPSAQKKGAPRNAFLGLCDEGLVKGIPAGQYSRSPKDKAYAVRAVALLKDGTHTTVNQLWSAVAEGEEAIHNSQMDVVLALWKNGLIPGKS